MKRLALIFLIFLFSCSVYSADKLSQEYLQNKKHLAVMNPVVENMVERGIRTALKKETRSRWKVKFTGYTLASMKEGIFKSLELSSKNVHYNDMTIPYVHLTSLTDYNYIDYKSDPILFKSNMTYRYDLELDEDTINAALNDEEYQKIIEKVNKKAYPLFVVKDVQTKIHDEKLQIIMTYNFPITRSIRDKKFIATSDFRVFNGKIITKNVHIDKAYGNLGLDKVANLINLLNPLEFTLDLMDSRDCSGIVENINIVDNMVKVDGKIFIKGSSKTK